MSEGDHRPLPRIGLEPYAAPFWEGTRNGELRVQECRECGERQWFPRPWCRTCAADDLDWVALPGTGTLFAHTVIRQPVKSPAFADDIPYAVGHIDLDGGVRMFSTITGCDVEAVHNGMDLEVVFEPRSDEVVLPLFRPP